MYGNERIKKLCVLLVAQSSINYLWKIKIIYIIDYKESYFIY